MSETATDSGTYPANAPTWPLWLFSLLIVALSFKQLRSGSFAGPAEWLTALGALVVIGEGLRKGALLRNPYVLGAAFVFAALSLGGVWALLVEPQRISLREAMAYIFAFLVIAAFVSLAWRRETKALTILAIVISLYLSLVSLLAFVPNPLRPAMWYYEMRLQGFSDNPNQLALLALVALLLLAHAEMQGVLRARVTVPLALGCAIAGMLSKSSALLATLTVTAVLLVAFALLSRLARRRNPGATVLRQPLGLGVACLVVLGNFIVEHPETVSALLRPSWDVVNDVMEADARQGSVRVDLWTQALAVGARSPLVGFGPGYHLEAHTPDAPLEAHNTVLDLFLVSGLVGLLPLVVIGGLALWGSRQNGHLAIVLLMGAAISSFALFHFVGRQPLFWIMIFAIVYCGAPYMLSRNPSTSQTRGA